MTALIVFDRATDVRALRQVLAGTAARRLLLCGLTSDPKTGAAIAAMVAALPAAPAIEDVDAARLVDREVETLRNWVVSRAAELGTLAVGGRTVREWLLPEGAAGSSWWYSLAAEHNPLLTEAYLVQAQVATVERLARATGCDRIIVAAGPGLLRDCLSGLTSGGAVTLVPLDGRQLRAERRGRRLRWLEVAKPIGACWTQAFRGWRARRVLGTPRPGPGADALLVTYFPALAIGTAGPQSRYLGPVENLLMRTGWTLRRLGLFMSLDGATFESALQTALAIRASGSEVELLDQWITPAVLARSGIRWIRHVASVLRIWAPRSSATGPGTRLASRGRRALLAGLFGIGLCCAGRSIPETRVPPRWGCPARAAALGGCLERGAPDDGAGDAYDWISAHRRAASFVQLLARPFRVRQASQRGRITAARRHCRQRAGGAAAAVGLRVSRNSGSRGGAPRVLVHPAGPVFRDRSIAGADHRTARPAGSQGTARSRGLRSLRP